MKSQPGKHEIKSLDTTEKLRSSKLRKGFAALLILISVLLLLINIDLFSSFNAYVNGRHTDIYADDFKAKVQRDYVSLTGNQTVRQKFTAKGSRISSVGLVFFCVRDDNRAGSLTVRITDEEGNTLAQNDVDIAPLINKKFLLIYPQGSENSVLKVRNNSNYYLVVESADITSDVDFGLYKMKKSDDVYSAIVYSHIKWKVIALYLALALFSALIVFMIPERKTAANTALLLLFSGTPLLCYMLVTKITGCSFRESGLSLLSYTGFMNILIIGLLWLILYLISGSKRFTVICMTVLNLVFAILNFALIQFRSIPLMFNDALEIKTAAMVAGSYKLIPDQYAFSVIVFSLLWIAVTIPLKDERRLNIRKRIAVLAAAAIWTAAVYDLIWMGNGLTEHGITFSGWDPLTTYTDNGYYLSFTMSAKRAFITKPEGYSVSAAEELAGRYESDKPDHVTAPSEETPNIIVIMNESFSDMEMFGKINTDPEVLPFFNSLEENVIRGTMHSSVYGGHTAVSEFEFLTGDSQRFMPLNSVAYTELIKSELPSLAWEMKARGYGGITAFHPGRTTSYSRDKVYPLLGFDKHISIDNMVAPKRIRGFTSDEADYQRVIAEYEEYVNSGQKAPYFMFNVTIQNHGGYTLDSGVVEPEQIRITDSDVQYEQLGQFLNLMKISDQELEKLIAYFSKVKEPTVILLFGDHQPKIDAEFYDKMFSGKDGLSDIEKLDMKHRVPFMIWANYDIPEKQGIEISANYLQCLLLDTIGAPMTGYQKFLNETMRSLPVISSVCTIDKDGVVYSPDDPTPYDELLNEYSILQYNTVGDKKHTIKDFFYLKQ